MHLTNTQKILAFSAFLIVVAVVAMIVTPKQTTRSTSLLQTNYDGSVSQISGVGFAGRSPDMPKELPRVRLYQSSESAQLVEKVITKYKLLPVEPGFWQSSNAKLSLDAASNTYTLSILNNFSSTQTVNLDSALTVGQEFLNELNLSNISPQKNQVEYLSGEFELQAVPPALAQFVRIPYAAAVDDFPLVQQQLNHLPITLLIDANNNITKATLYPFFPTTQEIESLPTITTDQALKNINHGGGVIVYASSRETADASLNQITGGSLNDVVVEYRSETDGNTAIPYYRFSGTLEDANGKQFQASIITPAVKL